MQKFIEETSKINRDLSKIIMKATNENLKFQSNPFYSHDLNKIVGRMLEPNKSKRTTAEGVLLSFEWKRLMARSFYSLHEKSEVLFKMLSEKFGEIAILEYFQKRTPNFSGEIFFPSDEVKLLIKRFLNIVA